MCTLLGTRGDGAWLLASTSDDPYTVRNQLVCATGSSYPYLAVRVVTEDSESPVPWNRMLTRGLNAAGLVYTYAYVHEPGNERAPLQQWAAEMLTCSASVEKAVEFMRQSLGNVLSGNYVLSDRFGGAVALEVSKTEMKALPADSGRLICTNIWTSLRMQVPDRWGAETASDRSSRVAALLAGGRPDLKSIALVTRDHSDHGRDAERPYGVSICNHGRTEGTISAEIFDPGRGLLWWTYGWPCGHARGYEAAPRTSWGRFVAFGVSKVSFDGEVTTLDGEITPLGVHLISDLEPAAP